MPHACRSGQARGGRRRDPGADGGSGRPRRPRPRCRRGSRRPGSGPHKPVPLGLQCVVDEQRDRFSALHLPAPAADRGRHRRGAQPALRGLRAGRHVHRGAPVQQETIAGPFFRRRRAPGSDPWVQRRQMSLCVPECGWRVRAAVPHQRRYTCPGLRPATGEDRHRLRVHTSRDQSRCKQHRRDGGAPNRPGARPGSPAWPRLVVRRGPGPRGGARQPRWNVTLVLSALAVASSGYRTGTCAGGPRPALASSRTGEVGRRRHAPWAVGRTDAAGAHCRARRALR